MPFNPFLNMKASYSIRKKDYVYSLRHLKYTRVKYFLSDNEFRLFKAIYWMACYKGQNGVICPIRFLVKKTGISYCSIKYLFRKLVLKGVVFKVSLRGRVNGYFMQLKKITKQVIDAFADASLVKDNIPNPDERERYYTYKKHNYDEDYEKKRLENKRRVKSPWDDDYDHSSSKKDFKELGNILGNFIKKL